MSAPERESRGRRRWPWAAAAAVAVLGIALVLLVTRNADPAASPEDPTPATSATATALGSTATPTPTPTTPGPPATGLPVPSTPTPTGPTENVDDLPPALPPVDLDDEVVPDDGVAVTLPALRAVEATAVGPGNVAGPALQVTVRIANDTGRPLGLDTVEVTMTHGGDLTPASPVDDPTSARFSGVLAPGESAEGVYVFSVPADARASVTVQVGYQSGASLAVFTGPAG
jgi:hypothetical protein